MHGPSREGISHKNFGFALVEYVLPKIKPDRVSPADNCLG
ncbi:hypothetical protein BDD14_1784 [Edaphobacter modestus]|uniref:Uncharacterized protein n=1 Tax=Edaphobacter modestus TaxID=388466 RepID=A0A4Q7YTU4_9BACT|nr:hypothetical protein BDD14_1784 [Edaphobacter modestus]